MRTMARGGLKCPQPPLSGHCFLLWAVLGGRVGTGQLGQDPGVGSRPGPCQGAGLLGDLWDVEKQASLEEAGVEVPITWGSCIRANLVRLHMPAPCGAFFAMQLCHCPGSVGKAMA